MTLWLVWGHLLATATLVGYYFVLSLIVIPALRTGATAADARVAGPASILAEVERRAMPLLLVALIVFLATGVVLMTSNQQYAGIGGFQSTWAGLLLVKHGVVVAMLVVGSILDGMIVRAGRDGAGSGLPARVAWTAGGVAALGALVLLLTAAAQTL